MNCGQCKKELPDKYAQDLCPHCGKDWRSDETPLILAGMVMLVIAIAFAGCVCSSGGHI